MICHTQLSCTAKRVYWRKFKEVHLNILFLFKKCWEKNPLQFKTGTCHPDIGISKRLTASYPFCVLLVCLHNSCPMDALEFWQNFYRSIWKDLFKWGGEKFNFLFSKILGFSYSSLVLRILNLPGCMCFTWHFSSQSNVFQFPSPFPSTES